MILKASQRAGGMQLARHLMNTIDNDHVTVHEMRGFISDNLHGAFKEAHAISRGTKCQQFLFSISLNPPEKEKVPAEVFESAVKQIERKLGLANQPRALVFHEKEGRRHAHCVWSRIDIESMTAINLPHFKMKLKDISRSLYLEHGWKMPQGLMNSAERNPLNFTREEWQQAKKIKCDPKMIKQTFQECWAVSDSRQAFAQVLEERGYYLAKGDRRGFVAVDWQGEVYAISRWVGIKTKEVKARLGSPDALPSVEETKARIETLLTDKFRQFADQQKAKHEAALQTLDKKRKVIVMAQRKERSELKRIHENRWEIEAKARTARLPKGIKAIWSFMTGKYQEIKRRNEAETQTCKQRDRQEVQALIEQQVAQRRKLLFEVKSYRNKAKIEQQNLRASYDGNEQSHSSIQILNKQTNQQRRERRT